MWQMVDETSLQEVRDVGIVCVKGSGTRRPGDEIITRIGKEATVREAEGGIGASGCGKEQLKV